MFRRRPMILTALSLLLPLSLVCWFFSGDQPNGLKAAFDGEFMMRPDGYPGIKEAYGFSFAEPPTQMDQSLMYQAVAKGQVDVICGFATDGRIAGYDLRVLHDDKEFFPPYYAAPLVRRDTLDAHPDLPQILDGLAGTITTADMQTLNYAVDEEHKKVETVAEDFLYDKGLIDPPSDDDAARERTGTIVVGGKNFTEQDILGEIMAQLIEDRLAVNVERKLHLGGTMICFNALKSGDLDLYAEYTGTGLVSILDRKTIKDPQKVYDTVKQAFADEYDLVWLEPFGFNNTYTLTMRESHAERLGIESISDLAAHVNKPAGVDDAVETEPDADDTPDAQSENR